MKIMDYNPFADFVMSPRFNLYVLIGLTVYFLIREWIKDKNAEDDREIY
jgi:hypothetical protein